ncbi:hypothetical protein [Phytoactinopolyspora mesophila]|uniref:Uncharacterized protein n=1 Tax=Phytoactinopolyspora mesophila TaxID=2650750 RepID=A0A7K3M256_9ACTN|nr:hypothetical protein [Phytoactinopolyspora mesophila]NDL57385.1 hypothetical protein [Phytoactinopolyspora mesophila]
MADNEIPAKPLEAPDADADEQRRPVRPSSADSETRVDPEEPELPPQELPQELPSDADPADAYEQTRIVDFDEDDYR